MFGQAILTLGLLMKLNKCILDRRIEPYIGLALGMSIVIFLGFRTLFVAIIIAGIFLFIRINGVSFRHARSLTFLCIFIAATAASLYHVDSIHNSIQNMIYRQESQNYSNKNYIRVIQWEYFNSYHFISGTERFFGSGFDSQYSDYGKFMIKGTDTDTAGASEKSWMDWGLIGMSWTGGIPLVLTLLWLTFRVLTVKLPSNSMYIPTWYLFLILSSITTAEFFRDGAFVFHAIALYLVNKTAQVYPSKIKRDESFAYSASNKKYA
jgi:hypothetical protein